MQDKKLYQKILGDALPLKNMKITHTPTIVGKLVEKYGMERFPDMFSRPFRNLWAIFAPSNSYYTDKTSLASLHCNTLTMTNIFTLKTVVLVIAVLA